MNIFFEHWSQKQREMSHHTSQSQVISGYVQCEHQYMPEQPTDLWRQTSDDVGSDALALLKETSFQALDVDWRHKAKSDLPIEMFPCSMGFRSGEHAGHGKTCTLALARKFCDNRAVCGLALSCWKMSQRGCCWRKGITTDLKMSWRLCFAFRFPRITTNVVLTSPHMPPQTISPPFPNGRTCWTQLGAKRSPNLWYTSCRLTFLKIGNLLSSENIAHAQSRRCQCRSRLAHISLLFRCPAATKKHKKVHATCMHRNSSSLLDSSKE